MVAFKEKWVDLRLPITGKIRTTRSPLHYYSEILGVTISVPLYTETDLGSIPQWLQSIFPKDGLAVFAYILHDYLYKIGTYTRKLSDRVLAEAMRCLGVAKWRINSVYLGLKIGGSKAWFKHRKNDILIKSKKG